MGFQLHGDVLTLKAAADFTAKYGHAVKIDATGKWALCGAGDRVQGILTDKPAAGAEAPAQLDGVAEVVLGGTVNPGDYVKSDANGAAIATTTAADHIFGVCVEGGTVGQTGAVLIFLGGIAF